MLMFHANFQYLCLWCYTFWTPSVVPYRWYFNGSHLGYPQLKVFGIHVFRMLSGRKLSWFLGDIVSLIKFERIHWKLFIVFTQKTRLLKDLRNILVWHVRFVIWMMRVFLISSLNVFVLHCSGVIFNGFYNEMTGADIILEAKFFFTFNNKPLENLTTLFCS